MKPIIFIGKFDENGGMILSKVIELDKGGVYISKVMPTEIEKNNSDILYYYRYSDTPFSADLPSEIDKWNKDNKYLKWHVLGSESLNFIKIRYIQWKIIFLPGVNGDNSPRFKGIALKYDVNLPPARPIGIKIMASDGKIRLKWLKNSEKDLKGYKIYYGKKSGNYFGKDASEGVSPIDVEMKNEVEITGLKNNLIYYFTIIAYDDENKSHESDFSDEVLARPLEKYAISK